MKLILSSVLLGFGGFDPMGAIIIIAALSHNVSKKQIYLFSIMALLSTTLVGVVCSIGISEGITYFSDFYDFIPDSVFALVELVIAVLLSIWFIRRTFYRNRNQESKGKKESRIMKYTERSMSLAGAIFSFWAMSDPTFWTVVALSAEHENVILTIICCAIWMVLGQLPLYALTVSVMFNAHEKAISKVNEILDKNNRRDVIHKIVFWIISLFIATAAVYFAIDVITYFLYGWQ